MPAVMTISANRTAPADEVWEFRIGDAAFMKVRNEALGREGEQVKAERTVRQGSNCNAASGVVEVMFGGKCVS